MSSPVLDSVMNEREDAMFQELTSSVSVGGSTISRQPKMSYSSSSRPTSSKLAKDQNYSTQNKIGTNLCSINIVFFNCLGRRQCVMSSPVLDSVMNEREDTMFQELIRSHNIQTSSSSLPENIGPTANK